MPRRAMSRHALPQDATAPASGFGGNKAALPSKPCAACGRAMSWRSRWARCWPEVKFCSQACRRQRGGPHPQEGTL